MQLQPDILRTFIPSCKPKVIPIVNIFFRLRIVIRKALNVNHVYTLTLLWVPEMVLKVGIHGVYLDHCINIDNNLGYDIQLYKCIFVTL